MRTPVPPMARPPPQQTLESKPTARGPTSSSHFPATAAERPRNTIAVENTGTTDERLQSADDAATTPSSRVKGSLNRDQAYTDPMHRWMLIDAGGMRHLGDKQAKRGGIENRARVYGAGITRQPQHAACKERKQAKKLNTNNPAIAIMVVQKTDLRRFRGPSYSNSVLRRRAILTC